MRIDELVAGARKPDEGGDRALRAARSGVFFPLLVNLGAAALIAAGGLVPAYHISGSPKFVFCCDDGKAGFCYSENG